MPGRLLETMSSSPLSGPDDANSRRKSGRVTRKPDFLAPEPTASAKRKRVGVDMQEDDVGPATSESGGEDDEEEDDDEEPDEEELKEQRSRKPKSAPKRPAAKKPKTNGATASLPIRSTTSKSRPRKKKAQAMDAADAEEAGGLYTEVFARGHTLDQVVAQWLRQFDEHESRALADLINFVLKSAGCNLQISEHDIADADGATDKVEYLQDEFQTVSTYPITFYLANIVAHVNASKMSPTIRSSPRARAPQPSKPP